MAKMGMYSAGFMAQMFKPSERQSKNLGRMSSSDLRKEYTRQAKVANKRIMAIEKAGLYSPAIANLNDKDIYRFGIKNQGLVTDEDVKKAYRGLMDFLNSTTSSRTGIKQTADKMIKNFNLTFNGNYADFTQKSRKIFDLYEDLRELNKKGVLKESDKYDLISDLNTLYEDGQIDENTSVADLLQQLQEFANQRQAQYNAEQTQLRFNWSV